LLINKADYLSEELREHWSTYFKEKKVNHIFFSALIEQDIIDKTDEDEPLEGENLSDQLDTADLLSSINTSHLFNRSEFLNLLHFRSKKEGKTKDSRLMVGMVGYPNVGKSSIINVICGRKRVGVAALPGKTKHF
jgi:large subunit GTPase 1